MEFFVEKKQEYLFIKVAGEVKTLDELRKGNRKIFNLMLENKAVRGILDLQDFRFPESYSLQLDNVENYDPSPEAKYLRLAVITTKAMESIGKFWEASANFKGYHYFKHFLDKEEGEKWLLK